MDDIDKKVLEVLAGQSPTYLIQPHATAFVLEGLEPGEVEESLIRHWGEGIVDHVTTTLVDDDDKEILDEQGNPKIIDQGWKINEQGIHKLKDENINE